VVLPARRLLAIDAGSHALKLLLAEEMFGRFRVLRTEQLDLRGDTPAAEERALKQAAAMIREWGDSPVALALPHHRALSFVMDLPAAELGDVRTAIEEESRRLSGLGESQIVHDYSPLASFGRHENPFWVTLCQSAEVQRQIERCGLGDLDLCEVTTSANALVAAFQAGEPRVEPSVLVDLGATGTVVAVVMAGQPVCAASFPLGGEAWVAAVAQQEHLDRSAAQARLADPGFWSGEAAGVLEEPVRRWLRELDRVLHEWLREHPDLKLNLQAVGYYLGGGASAMSGVASFLRRFQPLKFEMWPEGADPEETPGPRFAVAYGAALHALGRAPHPASLLPDEVRVYWNRHHSLQVLHSILFFLFALLVIALGIGTWQKLDLLFDKRRLLDQTRTALGQARQTELLSRQLATDYEAIRPLLQRQLHTVQTLQTLAALQKARGSNQFWYVLFGSEAAYDNALLPPSTNTPPATDTLEAATSARAPGHGFVAELCIPEQGEARRRILTQLVANLRSAELFRTVDSLPDDRRRPLVDAEVILPDSHSALLLEPMEDPFSRLEASADRRLVPPGPGGGATNNRTVTPRQAVNVGDRRSALPPVRGS
jgi:Tfp pilus assembly PilM family ATPase